VSSASPDRPGPAAPDRLGAAAPDRPGSATPDRFGSASAVADAVLYEGYVLYPYRASARKNQLRWQFGVLCPRSFAEADGSERWWTRTECLLAACGPGSPRLAVRVRALQLQHRAVLGRAGAGPGAAPGTPEGWLVVDGERFVSFDEAVEVVVDLPELDLSRPSGAARAAAGGAWPGAPVELEHRFSCPGGTDEEPILDRAGQVAGSLLRTRQELAGRVVLGVEAAPGNEALLRVGVTVENLTTCAPGPSARRDDVLDRSLIAVHTLLAAGGGRFLSLLDPPAEAAEAAAACHQEGSFPVPVGDDDGVVLASPIILYDHPAIAPESGGDLYDATEIDEILALRVLTLTDEEKAEARATDARAAAIIDRCEAMPAESWEALHGTVRPYPAPAGPAAVRPAAVTPPPGGPPWRDLPAGSGVPGAGAGEPCETPWWDPAADATVDPSTDSILVGDVEVRAGTAVRLRPSRRADAQDLFLAGLSATCAGVYRDVDGAVLVAVNLDDDPATGELAWQGRHLFFHPDEVEPLVGGRTA
jgi:hypothetical protein